MDDAEFMAERAQLEAELPLQLRWDMAVPIALQQAAILSERLAALKAHIDERAAQIQRDYRTALEAYDAENDVFSNVGGTDDLEDAQEAALDSLAVSDNIYQFQAIIDGIAEDWEAVEEENSDSGEGTRA